MAMQTNTCTAFSLSNSDKMVWGQMLQNVNEHSGGLCEGHEPIQKKCAVVHLSPSAVHFSSQYKARIHTVVFSL